VAHHAAFDKVFLNMEMKRLYAAPLKNAFFDTASLAMFLKRQEKSSYHAPISTEEQRMFSLDNLSREFNLPPITQRHNALSDAFAAAQLAIVLMKKLKRVGIKTLGDLGLAAIH
jgi:DNA polymerase III alpha subunit (gram-positive type)